MIGLKAVAVGRQDQAEPTADPVVRSAQKRGLE
jgi:hypothetical protein